MLRLSSKTCANKLFYSYLYCTIFLEKNPNETFFKINRKKFFKKNAGFLEMRDSLKLSKTCLCYLVKSGGLSSAVTKPKVKTVDTRRNYLILLGSPTTVSTVVKVKTVSIMYD